MKPIDQLKSVLAERGYDVISEDGYKMLEKAKILTSVDQARVLAQLVKDIAEANYNAGYYKGGTDQAFEDGKKLGEILNKQNKYDVM